MPNNQRIIDRWAAQRRPLIELVNRLPERGATWRPWDQGRTTLELVQHIASAGEYFLSSAARRPTQSVPQAQKLSEAGALLSTLFETQSAEISRLALQDLSEPITLGFPKATETAEDVLLRLVLHETHHKGQLWVYARMLGVEPPFFMQ